MAKNRYGSRQSGGSLQWVYYIALGFLGIWFLSSIFLNRSPIELLKTSIKSLPTTGSADSLLVIKKDSIIADLHLRLKACEGGDSFKRGIVTIDSPTLNMRSDPSLNSNIVLRIPANSEIEIMYYDTETFYLDNKPGKWCKVRYAGKEGWVWGNFIQEI